MSRLAVILLLVGVSLRAAVDTACIPSTNRYPWHIGWTVGVRGGIPEYTNVFITLSDTVSVAQLNAHISAANVEYGSSGEGQLVNLEAGNYTFNSAVNLKSGVELVGVGLVRVTNSAPIMFSGSTSIGTYTDLHSGYEQFSTNIVLRGGTVTAGDVVTLSETTHPDLWWVGVNGAGGTNSWSQSFEVFTATDGTNAVLRTPLARSLDPALRPVWKKRTGAQLQYAGVRGLYLTPGDNNGIELKDTVNCWVRECVIVTNSAQAVYGYHNINTELRELYVLGAKSGGDGYGVNADYDTVQGIGWTGLLIIDSLFEGQYHGVFLSGVTVAALALNVTVNEHAKSGVTFPTSGFNFHFKGGSDILFDNNDANYILHDSIHGNFIKITFWRNALTGRTNPVPNSFITAPNYHSAMIWLSTNNLYCSAVGNILGGQWASNSWAVDKYTGPTWASASSVQNGGMMFLGFLDGQPNDAEVEDTFTGYQNYNWRLKAVTNDTTIAGSPTPEASLLFSEKPESQGGLQWPAHPYTSPEDYSITNLRAGYFYTYGTNPPASFAGEGEGESSTSSQSSGGGVFQLSGDFKIQ